ncbi:serine/threonine protein kinase [Corynebacterium yudongzhengii]|uniref:non-specific serine/threonine protein kinase n=1 Tax=Corynebacterium yudongzhengii TaxID=2080740 RepID=A0A2U1T547_9CORY|nr:serine/threonine-protein kinase [Corynebacterium yudongzhengii]AWB80955.1 serine/threonine protein kinase [Corynebacterium yudongzhengii]PWC01119.1 serine/threonine protein kinase [Corynebacterium yudongzhengii]
MSEETKEQLQEQIGDDYRLQWIIGHGGMSTVWLADDTRHDREVAIKFLRPEFSNNEEFLDRFRNEAIAAESISSDHVVATYDYREVPDPAGHTNCFIAMEYVRGESLADLLSREGALDEDIALDVLEQAAHGLSITHRQGLIHRDIKPGNLMITQSGEVKITDFGIAKAAAAVPLTRTGMVVGTAQYVSPEQAQGFEVTSATDVYSLGVVGYEMLAGHRPFSGDSGVSVALAHVNNAPPPLPTSISAEARELIGIALRKDPQTRFADGNEFALAVNAVRDGRRPPQPASAAMSGVAQEPSPTASTHMLGQVARPRTTQPAAGTGASGAAAKKAGQKPARKSAKKSSGGAFGIGLLIAAIIAIAGAIGVWTAAQAGLFDRQPRPTPETTEPEVVTEWVTPTEETVEPNQEAPPEQVTTTVRPEPESAPAEPTARERETLSPPPLTSRQPAPPRPQPNQPSVPPAPTSIPDAPNPPESAPGASQTTLPAPGGDTADDPVADLENLLGGV